LRDITNCTIGFQSLARETGIMEKSLMRMLSVRGNPQANNIFHVIEVLQRLNELKSALPRYDRSSPTGC
jgi:DNA-binding phage protein